VTTIDQNPTVCVYGGDELARYGFGQDHPFGPDRFYVFWKALAERDLESVVCKSPPVLAERAAIERFHTPQYVDEVIQRSRDGAGYLDMGDTPAFVGVYEAASYVVGSTLDAVDRINRGECRRAFVPIAGLHHARRNSAAGFCVFNDCGVVIETLRKVHGIERVAYVDIDAHHGDGVFYAFEEDPNLIFVDVHEDGRFLYPGTGAVYETGSGPAKGTKLNIPVPPNANDTLFLKLWPKIEEFIAKGRPEFILLQCGADSLDGDPITHLEYSAEAHAHAARSLCGIAEKYCRGRILAVGGGGYNRQNIADAWTGVVKAFVDTPQAPPDH
jgi:acetoin utilization protein AcuC